jgi:hypothetical protein
VQLAFSIAILLGLVALLGFAIVKLNDFWTRRSFRGGAKVSDQAMGARLPRADFDEVERDLGGKVPLALRNLYSRPGLTSLKGASFTDAGGEERILVGFLPLDSRMLAEVWPGVWKRECPFADAGDGDYLFVRLTDEQAADGPVYIFFHDGGDREIIFPSVKSFAGAISGKQEHPSKA